MDLYQAQDFFKQMYPNKEIKFDFDDICHKFYELSMTDGVPNLVHHCECNKVKVIVEGIEPIYVPIQSHRLCIEHNFMCDLIAAKMVKKSVS